MAAGVGRVLADLLMLLAAGAGLVLLTHGVAALAVAALVLVEWL